MDSLKYKTLSIFLLIIISSTNAKTEANDQVCVESICGRTNGYVSIRFPFRLITNSNNTPQQPNRCAYPGFDLYCDESTNQTLLNLPNAGNFTVQGIDYWHQKIQLGDPEDCLAKKLQFGLHLSNTPFYAYRYRRNLSLYSCAEDSEIYTKGDLFKRKISCLSSTTPNRVVIGTQYEMLMVDRWCDFIGNISVSDLSHLGSTILLDWGEPMCGLCEGNLKRCGFKGDDSTLETMCLDATDYDPPTVEKPLSKRTRYRIGLSVALGVPVIVVFSLLLFRVLRYNRRRKERAHNRPASIQIASSGR